MKASTRIILGVIILAVLFYLLGKIDFKEVWTLVVEANNWFFLLALLFCGFAFLVYDFRAAFFAREIAPVKYFFHLHTTMAGFFVNMITPGAQHGGDPVRAYFLGKKYKKPKSKLFGVILADKFFHMVISFLWISASILFVLNFVEIPVKLKITLEILLTLIILLLSWLSYLSFSKVRFNIEAFLKRFHWLVPEKALGSKKGQLAKILVKHFDHFSKTFKKAVKDKHLLVIGITLSVVYWLLNYLSSYFLFFSFGEHVSFILVIVVINLSNLLGLFSPSPGGLGLIEGSMIVAYSALGVNLSVAVAVSLLSRIIYYFYTIFLGGISLVHLEHSVK